MESNGWPFKSCVFRGVHGALNSGTKGLWKFDVILTVHRR